jgi:hypothetical protein
VNCESSRTVRLRSTVMRTASLGPESHGDHVGMAGGRGACKPSWKECGCCRVRPPRTPAVIRRSADRDAQEFFHHIVAKQHQQRVGGENGLSRSTATAPTTSGSRLAVTTMTRTGTEASCGPLPRFQERPAIHHRHHQVEDDDVGPFHPGLFQGHLAVPRCGRDSPSSTGASDAQREVKWFAPRATPTAGLW